MSDLSDFDLDFTYGHEGEQLVRDILTGGLTVEVKRDRRWVETGNIYVESAFYSRATHNWIQSGIMVTKADRWALVLEGLVIIATTADITMHYMGAHQKQTALWLHYIHHLVHLIQQ